MQTTAITCVGDLCGGRVNLWSNDKILLLVFVAQPVKIFQINYVNVAAMIQTTNEPK